MTWKLGEVFMQWEFRGVTFFPHPLDTGVANVCFPLSHKAAAGLSTKPRGLRGGGVGGQGDEV